MPNMQLQTLPIGEQSFEKLRRENRLYVDKTEYMTSDGRIDLLITTDKFRYVIECKIDSTPAVALKQIHDKQYGLSWTLDEKENILIGLNFSTTSRRPDAWIIERQDGTISESGVKSGPDSKSVRAIGQRKSVRE